MSEHLKAVVHCSGDCYINGGKRACSDGCIGCGLCVRACEAGAMELIVREHVYSSDGTEQDAKPVMRRHAHVNREKCTGCGKCAEACPKHLIGTVPEINTIQPLCSNRKPGKEARTECADSCISCGICERNCPAGAVHVTGLYPVIDQVLCIACGMCASKCPRGVIRDADGIIAAEF